MESAGKITLDQESFRALASDVRVGILKRLDARRETVTDLSNLLALSKPTLLEHLEKLQSAGLVKRIDEGRKWIYYELSQKGRKILHPERVAITLALASAVVLAAIGAFSLFLAGNPAGQSGSPRNLSAQPIAEAKGLIGADPIGFGLILLVFALLSVGAALVLRLYGTRRRDRFFEQMRVA
jgi:DNA-binding transcriptional ArsR family regulator